jgi:glutaredoxin-related protein
LSQRTILDPAKTDAAALQAIAGFHPEAVDQVKQATAQPGILVVGMAQNPYVKKARKALDAAGIPFRYLEFGNYFSQWKPRLAIKLWSGWPTFPQIFVEGTLIGGYRELQIRLEAGTLKKKS